MDFSGSSIEILLALAPGFLAFRIAMIDAEWSQLRTLDVFYGSLSFSVFSYAAWEIIVIYTGWTGTLSFLVTILFVSLAAGVAWKRWGWVWVYALLRKWKITNQDHRGNVWQKIFNDPNVYVTQINAYLKDGSAIGCDDIRAFDRAEWRKQGIFPYYPHKEGQIAFIPNRRLNQATMKWENLEDIEAEGWGVRTVYINPSELERLELRLAGSGKKPKSKP